MVTPPTIVGTVTQGRNPSAVAGNTITVSHTVVSGTGALVVLVGWENFLGLPPDITWGGTAVPSWLHGGSIGATKCALYVLVNPTPGTANLVSVSPGPFGSTQSLGAINVANFAAVRWAENPSNSSSPPDSVDSFIYTASTDLVIDLFGWGGQGFPNSANVSVHAGQTLLFAQNGITDGAGRIACSVLNTPVNAGTPPNQLAYSTMGWTKDAAAQWAHYLIAIKGLDNAAPVGLPTAIGRMTDTVTVDQQPPAFATPVADTPWKWRHEVPGTHRFLVVTVLGYDLSATAVYWQVDGAAEVPLVLDTSASQAAVWTLASAPVGVGYLRVVLLGRRWYGASAYSLSTISITAAAKNDLGTSLAIPSSAGAVVIDHIGNLNNVWMTFTPTAPQEGLFYQPIMGGDNPNQGVVAPGSITGAGSLQIATGASTLMAWTLTPGTVLSQQAGFSFVGIAPPEPIEEVIPIRRLRRTPVLHHEDAWIFHAAFQLDLQVGIGRDGASTLLGHDPQVMLRWSNNGGKTWSNEHWVSAGKLGQYRRRALWRRLGRARNRVYEVVVSDPVAWNLLAAYLTVEGERPL